MGSWVFPFFFSQKLVFQINSDPLRQSQLLQNPITYFISWFPKDIQLTQPCCSVCYLLLPPVMLADFNQNDRQVTSSKVLHYMYGKFGVCLEERNTNPPRTGSYRLSLHHFERQWQLAVPRVFALQVHGPRWAWCSGTYGAPKWWGPYKI